MTSRRFLGAALMSAVVLPSFLLACTGDDTGTGLPGTSGGLPGADALCCTEFKAGATVDVKIGGSVQSQVAVQAVADFAGIASTAIDDVTTACKGIATDLDTPPATLDAAEKEPDRQKRMEAYCSAAVSAIGSIKGKAQGTLDIVAVPPKCEASISAKANCQAKCDVSGKCDIKANPPTCTGGKLEVSCKGGCTAKAGASVSCTGKCEGTCKGSCTTTGGVKVACKGKCDGKCTAKGNGNQSGVAADGTCDGECEGTCTASADAPAVECKGSCDGDCSVKCTGTAEASVKCDGSCDADYEPLQCTGGKLEGGCKVDAKCDANCDASVSAKASCSPPSVTVAFRGAVDASAAGKLRATLEANLGVILAFRARAEGMLAATGSFSGNVSAITDIKVACLPVVVASVGTALSDIGAAGKATGSIAGSVGL